MSSVLIVDDEASVRFALSELLSERGHTVVTANSGAEALGKLEEADAVVTVADSDQRQPNVAKVYVRLLDPSARARSQDLVMDEVRRKVLVDLLGRRGVADVEPQRLPDQPRQRRRL